MNHMNNLIFNINSFMHESLFKLHEEIKKD